MILTPLDASVMLQLNNAHAEETSLLDDAGLNALLDAAFYARGIGQAAIHNGTKTVRYLERSLS